MNEFEKGETVYCFNLNDGDYEGEAQIVEYFGPDHNGKHIADCRDRWGDVVGLFEIRKEIE